MRLLIVLMILIGGCSQSDAPPSACPVQQQQQNSCPPGGCPGRWQKDGSYRVDGNPKLFQR